METRDKDMPNSRKRDCVGNDIMEMRNADAVWRDNANVYVLFWLIQPAYKYAKEHGSLPVFAVDKEKSEGGGGGKKKYIVAGYNRFLQNCYSLKPTARKFYEVLVAEWPCHLYIDFEFLRARNKKANEKELWICQTLKDELIEFLLELKIIDDKKQVEIITMDSSNEKKSSKHYIFVLDGGKIRFENVRHCGAFMRKFCNRILRKYGMEPSDNIFFVWGEREKEEEDKDPIKNLGPVFDMGVYTDGRNMRFYGSTKGEGPYRPLFLEGEDKTKETFDKDVFLSTVIQRIPDYTGLRKVRCLEEDGTEPVSTNSKTAQRIDMQSKIQSKKSVIAGAKIDTQSDMKRNKDGSMRPSDEIPQIADVIADAISTTCSFAGSLKPIYYHEGAKSIRFESNSKMCSIKGSEHGGNHIWFRCFLRRYSYIQGCFSTKAACTDGSGHGLITKEMPLPDYVRKDVDKFLNESKNKASTGKLYAEGLIRLCAFTIKLRSKSIKEKAKNKEKLSIQQK